MSCMRAVLIVILLAGCGPAESPRRADVAPPVEEVNRPPRLEIGHTLGAEDAPVEVVEFSDFGCSSCADFAVQTLPALHREFVDSGLVRWRLVPIRQGFHHGGKAAKAAECAALQGGFWPMHDALAEGQREWQVRGDPLPVLTRYAGEIGLNVEEFGVCYRDDVTGPTLRLHDMVALSMGIRGTPTFLVGGQRVFGALETKQFARILREKVAARRAEGEAGR